MSALSTDVDNKLYWQLSLSQIQLYQTIDIKQSSSAQIFRDGNFSLRCEVEGVVKECGIDDNVHSLQPQWFE